MGVVELLVRAHVDEQRALLLGEAELARGERQQLDAGVSSGPRLSSTMAWKFGGSGRAPRARGDELVLVADGQRRVVGALEADRRGDLEVHPGPAAQRAAEVARPQLDGVGQGQQPLVQRAEDPARAVGRLDGQIGPGDVVDEQRVARQDRPRPSLRRVRPGEGRVLGAMAGVCTAVTRRRRAPTCAVLEGLVVVGRRGQPVDVDAGARGRRQPPVARDVVGVVVGLEDVLDRDAEVPRELEVLVHLERGSTTAATPAFSSPTRYDAHPEVVVDELAEDHAHRAYDPHAEDRDVVARQDVRRRRRRGPGASVQPLGQRARAVDAAVQDVAEVARVVDAGGRLRVGQPVGVEDEPLAGASVRRSSGNRRRPTPTTGPGAPTTEQPPSGG